MTSEIPKQLSKKCFVMLTYLFNRTFYLKRVRDTRKVTEIIMQPIPGKLPNNAKLYRLLSLFVFISKLFVKNLEKYFICFQQLKFKIHPNQVRTVLLLQYACPKGFLLHKNFLNSSIQGVQNFLFHLADNSKALSFLVMIHMRKQ